MSETPLFDALKWGEHPSFWDGFQARMPFRNGYEASVVCGGSFFEAGVDTYEVAALEPNGWLVLLENGETMKGYLDAAEVEEFLIYVSQIEAV